MAIALEFHSLILRRDRLEALLPAGWPQFLAEYDAPPDGWADDDLVRFGAMNADDIAGWDDHWVRRGLSLTGESGRSPDMTLHAAFGGAGPVPCDWLEIEDERRARFTGRREPLRRPAVASPWTDQTVALTVEHVTRALTTPPERRLPVFLKHWETGFGLLITDGEARDGLVVIDRDTDARESYRLIEDLLNAGWALD